MLSKRFRKGLLLNQCQDDNLKDKNLKSLINDKGIGYINTKSKDYHKVVDLFTSNKIDILVTTYHVCFTQKIKADYVFLKSLYYFSNEIDDYLQYDYIQIGYICNNMLSTTNSIFCIIRSDYMKIDSITSGIYLNSRLLDDNKFIENVLTFFYLNENLPVDCIKFMEYSYKNGTNDVQKIKMAHDKLKNYELITPINTLRSMAKFIIESGVSFKTLKILHDRKKIAKAITFEELVGFF